MVATPALPARSHSYLPHGISLLGTSLDEISHEGLAHRLRRHALCRPELDHSSPRLGTAISAPTDPHVSPLQGRRCITPGNSTADAATRHISH
ncbi:hypothetical protein CLOM_g23747 [Closterium sp. NIES-68]|nr:hypothetical protein CLOM_g23747 [Closterium sp. NIES-68]